MLLNTDGITVRISLEKNIRITKKARMINERSTSVIAVSPNSYAGGIEDTILDPASHRESAGKTFSIINYLFLHCNLKIEAEIPPCHENLPEE